MSLRPAQALVAESSKFSLRTFFESSNSPAPSPASAVPEGLLTPNAPMQPSRAMMVPTEPEHPLSPTSAHALAAAGAPPKLVRPASAPAAGPGKFTFNGLVPTTTPVQLQHNLLQQHQKAAIQAGLAGASKTAASDPNEVLRLKAQVLSLTERANQLNANLASTSESVVRGNKALTTERAQFHAKFASLTKKLEATQEALAGAEALPVEAAKNANLLNAKILELQGENHQLTRTRVTLEATIDAKAAEVAAMHEASQATTETQAALQARCDDLTGKYAALAKQHSEVLARQEALTQELEEHQAALISAEVRAEAATAGLEATRVDVATADQLVDELDAKLADARMAAPTGACDACGCGSDGPDGPGDAVYKEARAHLRRLAERRYGLGDDNGEDEPVFEDGQGVHFRGAIIESEEWNLMERAAMEQVEAESQQVRQEAPTEAAPAMCCPKTLRCEELERFAIEAHGKMHCAEEADCEQLAEEHRFADAMAKRARWSLTNNAEERVVVAHVYTNAADADADAVAMDDAPYCCLSASIRDNPLAVAQPYDDSFHLARVGAPVVAGAEEEGGGGAANRTNAFVQAVSADLKFHMDGSQARYKSSSTTGMAPRA